MFFYGLLVCVTQLDYSSVTALVHCLLGLLAISNILVRIRHGPVIIAAPTVKGTGLLGRCHIF